MIDDDFEPDLAGIPGDRFAVRSVEDAVARCEHENRQRPVAVVGHVRVIRTSAEVLANVHGRSPARCVRYLRTKLLPLPDASAIVAGPSGSPFARDGFTGRRGSAARSAPPHTARSVGEARRSAAQTPGPPKTLATTLTTGPGRSGAKVALLLPQRRGGVKSAHPLTDGHRAPLRRSPSRPFGRTSTRK